MNNLNKWLKMIVIYEEVHKKMSRPKLPFLLSTFQKEAAKKKNQDYFNFFNSKIR